MFTFNNSATPKTVVKSRQTGEIRTATLSEADMAELIRLRAEKAARETKQNGSPKAKPVEKPITYGGYVYEGHKCVRVEGNFAPINLSLRKLQLLQEIGLENLIAAAKNA
jgi:hypothetical protein